MHQPLEGPRLQPGGSRNTNVLRIGLVAELLTRNRVGVIVSAISPFKEARDQVRRRIIDFIGVYVDAPIEVCAERETSCSWYKLGAEVTRPLE
jgi:adenylylsulfate kinase-like enzyme